MEAAINEFQPLKAPGPDGLYPVLLQSGWNQLKEFYQVIFQACVNHSDVPLAWKVGTGIFLSNDYCNFLLTETVGKTNFVSY